MRGLSLGLAVLFSPSVIASVSLEEGVRLALSNSLEIQSQRASIEAKEIELKKVLTAYLPKLDASFRRTSSRTDSWTQTSAAQEEWQEQEGIGNSLTLTLSETIDLQGKVYRSYQRTRLERDSLRETLRYSQSQTIQQVIDLYYRYQESVRSLASLEARRKRNDETLQRLRTEIKIGKKSPSDLGEIEYQAAAISVEILRAEQNQADLLKQLGTLLYGKSQDAPDVLIEDGIQEPKFLEGWQANLANASDLQHIVSQRGDTQSLTKRLAASESARDENLYDFVPDLDLFVDYTRDYTRLSNRHDPADPDRRLAFGLSARWNLFSGGSDWLEVRQSAQQRHQDQIELSKAMQSGVLELSTIKAQLIADHKLVAASRVLLESARKRYQSAQAQYELGKMSAPDLLEAGEAFANAEIGFHRQRYLFYRQYAKWQHLNGGLNQLFAHNR